MSDDVTLRFAEFELDLVREELRRDGVPVALHATPFQVLRFLVENRDRVVSKQEVIDAVWPDVAVSEASLSTSLKEVRQALGDDGSSQRWVKTFRGRGFRFVGRIGEPSTESEAESLGETRERTWLLAPLVVGLVALVALVGWRWLAGQSPPPRSVVVYPLDDMSPHGDQEYLALGLAEELTDTLSGIPDLEVVARTSATHAKRNSWSLQEIREKLDAEVLAEGSVRMERERLRITIQLISTADGFHIWSETWDRPMNELFAVQSEVSQAVATALRRELGGVPVPGTHEVRAYEAVLLGTHTYNDWTPEALERAVAYYEEAIQIDPDYALAWAMLASVKTNQWNLGFVEDPAVLSDAGAAADRALALDPRSVTGLVIRSRLLARAYRWDEAIAVCSEALALEPTHPDPLTICGIQLVQVGRAEEGIRMVERAVEVAPLVPGNVIALATDYLFRQDDPARALVMAERAVDLAPDNPAFPSIVSLVLRSLGREEEALEMTLGSVPPEARGYLRRVYEQDGFPGLDRTLHSMQVQATGDECLGYEEQGARFAMIIREHDLALRCLERGYRDRSLNIATGLKVDHLWDPIRDDPRFQAILEGMNLAD